MLNPLQLHTEVYDQLLKNLTKSPYKNTRSVISSKQHNPKPITSMKQLGPRTIAPKELENTVLPPKRSKTKPESLNQFSSQPTPSHQLGPRPGSAAPAFTRASHIYRNKITPNQVNRPYDAIESKNTPQKWELHASVKEKEHAGAVDTSDEEFYYNDISMEEVVKPIGGVSIRGPINTMPPWRNPQHETYINKHTETNDTRKPSVLKPVQRRSILGNKRTIGSTPTVAKVIPSVQRKYKAPSTMNEKTVQFNTPIEDERNDKQSRVNGAKMRKLFNTKSLYEDLPKELWECMCVCEWGENDITPDVLICTFHYASVLLWCTILNNVLCAIHYRWNTLLENVLFHDIPRSIYVWCFINLNKFICLVKKKGRFQSCVF